MRAHRRASAIAVTGVLAAAAVGTLAQPAGAAPGDPVSASATLVGHDGQPIGTVDLGASSRGVRVTLHVEGLTPGEHGVHLLANGDCGDAVDPATGATTPFGAAGGHFDPGHSGTHGSPYAGNAEAHAGDLPNVPVRDDGTGDLLITTNDLSFVGTTAVSGHAIAVDAQGDDQVTQPDGGSGEHLACGLVVAQPTIVTDRYALPGADTFPEGIATDADGTTAWVGSAATGAIFRIDLASGQAAVLSPGGTDGRTAALGLHLDPFGHLFVAGGATGTVAVIDPATGETIASLGIPPVRDGGTFLNDVAVTADGTVYVTDSRRPVLFRAHATAEGVGDLEPWLDLSTGPIADADGFNLNGIAATADGTALVAVQTNTGQLWRIDTATGAIQEIAVDGLEATDGPTPPDATSSDAEAPLGAFPGGDGVVVDGDALTVVQNAAGTLTRLTLSPDATRATVVAAVHDRNLRFPTTAAPAGDRLLVVNAQLDQMGGDPVLPFVVTAVPADLGAGPTPPVPPTVTPPPPAPQPPLVAGSGA
jgi:Cu-Zn family superoxide dismutase